MLQGWILSKPHQDQFQFQFLLAHWFFSNLGPNTCCVYVCVYVLLFCFVLFWLTQIRPHCSDSLNMQLLQMYHIWELLLQIFVSIN